jgi:alpha-beta hydrolase superfamily lysophospholipase
MEKTKSKKWRYYTRWIVWILVVQVILANISASVYAYKFTHFYSAAAPQSSSRNIFIKTWKLFTGPSFYKDTCEPRPPFPYETVALKISNGNLIDAWYSATDSAKACIILVHGFSTNKSFLTATAARYKQWGYSVLLIDLRAHGKSGGKSITLGMEETEEVQQAFLFARSRGNANIILHGVSLGAGICIKAVSEGRADAAAIIADMPFNSLHNHFKARARVLGFPSEPFGTLVTAWIGIEQGFNPFSYSIASYARNVHCPVLVEWGEQDPYVMRNEVESVYQALASKNKKLVVYPDVGHDSFLKAAPGKWERETRGFLDSLPL